MVMHLRNTIANKLCVTRLKRVFTHIKGALRRQQAAEIAGIVVCNPSPPNRTPTSLAGPCHVADSRNHFRPATIHSLRNTGPRRISQRLRHYLFLRSGHTRLHATRPRSHQSPRNITSRKINRHIRQHQSLRLNRPQRILHKLGSHTRRPIKPRLNLQHSRMQPRLRRSIHTVESNNRPQQQHARSNIRRDLLLHQLLLNSKIRSQRRSGFQTALILILRRQQEPP